MPKLKQDQYDKIIQDYLAGYTQQKVGELNGITRDAVKRIVHRSGIDVRKYTGKRQPNKKWFWNESFFDGDLPIVAYWAGFLMADGCIEDTGKATHTLIVYVHPNDLDHIKSFCNDLGLPVDGIYTRKEGHVGIQVTSTHLGDSLFRWGIVPRKTYNFVEPNFPFELLHHYLRGWADGDGHIYATGSGARFSVSGNPLALDWYANSLRALGYSGNLSFQNRSENCSILYAGGEDQTQEILDLLLVQDNFKLERKWNVYYKAKFSTTEKQCLNCGKTFTTRDTKYRPPANTCSIQCNNELKKRPIIDGKIRCARCKQLVLLEEMSANKSYCKICWKEKRREYRSKS